MTPGLDFDPARGARTLRFSYAGSTADIAEGLRRLAAWARALSERHGPALVPARPFRPAIPAAQEPLSARDHQPRRFGPSSALSSALPSARSGAASASGAGAGSASAPARAVGRHAPRPSR